MESFFPYLIAVNLLLLLAAGYFRIFLAKQRRFQWNRIFLIGGLVAAMLLPLLRLEVVPPTLPSPRVITMLPEIVIGESVEASTPTASTGWSVLQIALAIYLIGAMVALLAIAYRHMRIVLLIMRAKRIRQEGYMLITTDAEMGPASYFRYIFWNASLAMDAQSEAVAMAHERCHSRQLHSLDLLLVDLVRACCWFNPAIYWIRRDLRLTHEYLADEAALTIAGPEGIKQLLLARQLDALQQPTVAHCFFSLTKARIMILTESSKPKTLLRYLSVLPLAVAMVACTSLSHPMDNGHPEASLASYASGDSVQTVPNNQSVADQQFYNLNERLLESTLPTGSSQPNAKGMVCMGRQPQVLNMDTLLSLDELENVDSHPYLLNRDRVMKRIGYPEEAKAKGLKGKVLVKILVDETGHVARYQFINDSDAILRDAVQLHVKELLFKPGLENGQPSEWWVIMPFNFGMPGC